MYQEIKPSKGVDNIIDSFWIFSKNKVSENFKVLPDTCADLIFDLKKNEWFVSGIMTNYQFRELETESDLIGIRFKIEKFGFLSKIPIGETKNQRVELSEILPSKKLDILNKLTNLDGIYEKIKFLEQVILFTFEEDYQRQDKFILSIGENIRLLQGNVKIGELAKSNFISLRQLERRFKSYLGLTVKEFSNIVRFNNAKRSIVAFTNTSLLEIAFDTGFFDHSHMAYEFKRISGENPSFFR